MFVYIFLASSDDHLDLTCLIFMCDARRKSHIENSSQLYVGYGAKNCWRIAEIFMACKQTDKIDDKAVPLVN